MFKALAGLDENPSFTGEQKAYIQYVRSIWHLAMPAWENRDLGNEILGWLQGNTSPFCNGLGRQRGQFPGREHLPQRRGDRPRRVVAAEPQGPGHAHQHRLRRGPRR